VITLILLVNTATVLPTPRLPDFSKVYGQSSRKIQKNSASWQIIREKELCWQLLHTPLQENELKLNIFCLFMYLPFPPIDDVTAVYTVYLRREIHYVIYLSGGIVGLGGAS
jgi:hypothetical protein